MGINRAWGSPTWGCVVVFSFMAACTSSQDAPNADDSSSNDSDDGGVGPEAGDRTVTTDTTTDIDNSDVTTSVDVVNDADESSNEDTNDNTSDTANNDGTTDGSSQTNDTSREVDERSESTTSNDTNDTGDAGNDGTTTDPSPNEGECGAIVPFDVERSPTRELFVDANADEGGDGSVDAPFADLESAFAELEPGTAVRILPGTYAGGAFVSNAHGTPENPIWIGGVPGEERPVIEGGSNAIQFSPASYLVVHDLELSGQESNGLNVDDGEVWSQATHHLVFRNLFVHDLGDGGNQDCIKLSGVTDHFVLDSEFRGCSGGSAVDHVGCQRGVIARNLFVDLTGNGVQSKGGSEDILITQNRFLNAGERAVNMGGSTGFEFFRPPLIGDDVNMEASDIRVVSNLFRGGTSPIAFVGCVECLVANNTIVDPERWVVRILQETTSTSEFGFAQTYKGRFINNIVYYSRELLSTHVNIGPDTTPESFTFSNNLWYAHDNPEASAPDSLPVTESGGIYGQDPALEDLADGNVAIDEGSAAAGAGVSVEEVTNALDGACFAQPPSIGALEVP